MHSLTRYILRQSLGTTLFVTIALGAAIWLTPSLRLVYFIVNRGPSAEFFFYLGILVLPREPRAGSCRMSGTPRPC